MIHHVIHHIEKLSSLSGSQTYAVEIGRFVLTKTWQSVSQSPGFSRYNIAFKGTALWHKFSQSEGEWVYEGPWQEDIQQALAALRDRLIAEDVARQEAEYAAEVEKQAAAKAEHERKRLELVALYEGGE